MIIIEINTLLHSLSKNFMALIYSLGGLACTTAHMWRSARGTARGSPFSPSTMWILKIKLRLLGFVTNTVTHPPFPSPLQHCWSWITWLGDSRWRTWSSVIGNRSWGSVVIHTLKESSVVSVTIRVSSNSSMNSRPRWQFCSNTQPPCIQKIKDS